MTDYKDGPQACDQYADDENGHPGRSHRPTEFMSLEFGSLPRIPFPGICSIPRPHPVPGAPPPCPFRVLLSPSPSLIGPGLAGRPSGSEPFPQRLTDLEQAEPRLAGLLSRGDISSGTRNGQNETEKGSAEREVASTCDSSRSETEKKSQRCSGPFLRAPCPALHV